MVGSLLVVPRAAGATVPLAGSARGPAADVPVTGGGPPSGEGRTTARIPRVAVASTAVAGVVASGAPSPTREALRATIGFVSREAPPRSAGAVFEATAGLAPRGAWRPMGRPAAAPDGPAAGDIVNGRAEGRTTALGGTTPRDRTGPATGSALATA
jgi:hypothetical protein